MSEKIEKYAYCYWKTLDFKLLLLAGCESAFFRLEEIHHELQKLVTDFEKLFRAKPGIEKMRRWPRHYRRAIRNQRLKIMKGKEENDVNGGKIDG